MLALILATVGFALLAAVLLVGFLFHLVLSRARLTTRKGSMQRSAAVVVLGDIGRSPRMCYHVSSLAAQGWRVSVVAYAGVGVPPSLQRGNIKHHPLFPPPRWIARLPRHLFILAAPFKLLWQTGGLFLALAVKTSPPPEIILVQTPPALPTLLVVQLVAALLGSRIVIDWHNLGYTILGLRLGQNSLLVKLAALLERLGGKYAFAHLFVTRAMRDYLRDQWHLRGYTEVLYDRPPSHFHRANVEETHRLFVSLSERLNQPMAGTLCAESPWGTLESESLPRAEKRPRSLSASLTSFWPPCSEPFSTPFTRHRSTSTDHTLPVIGPSSQPGSPNPNVLQTVLETGDHVVVPGEEEHLNPPSSSPLRPSSPNLSGRRHANLRPASPSVSSSVDPMPLGWSEGEDTLRPDRPALAVSSTSWTADEDFDLLLGAVEAYEHRARQANELPASPSVVPATQLAADAARLPKLLVIVTGKGDLKAHYERLIDIREREEQYRWVRVRTAWLEPEEYPILLGSADIGISLHSSSSGLDLPMKVVDMLGCGLPVLALDFACLNELVQEGRNGLIFNDTAGLTDGLVSVLSGFPKSDTESLRLGITLGGAFPDIKTNAGGHGATTGEGADTWEKNWDNVVKPLLDAPPLYKLDQSNRNDTSASGNEPGPSFGLQNTAVPQSGHHATAEDVSAPSLISSGPGIRPVRTGDLRRRSGWSLSASASSPLQAQDVWEDAKRPNIPRIHVEQQQMRE